MKVAPTASGMRNVHQEQFKKYKGRAGIPHTEKQKCSLLISIREIQYQLKTTREKVAHVVMTSEVPSNEHDLPCMFDPACIIMCAGLVWCSKRREIKRDRTEKDHIAK